MTLKTLDLDDGKYILLHDEGHGGMTVLRNGEVWRNETGDKLILAMFEEIEMLKSDRDYWKQKFYYQEGNKTCNLLGGMKTHEKILLLF